MSVELEKAIELITSDICVLEAEEIAVFQADGRMLAENIFSSIDQPPFNRSPLDGYAFIASDSSGASKSSPAVLEVVDKVFAGDYAGVPVRQGEAVRITTGGMLPEGCDCVIRQEDTDAGEVLVKIYKEMQSFDNYVFKGEDFSRGDLLAHKGVKLDAAALAVCASSGVSAVKVIRKPRVSVISIGDELVETGQSLPQGKIYDANLCYLTTRLKNLGIEIVMAATVGDVKQDILNCIEKAVDISDIVITSGGVSVGEKDLMPLVMKDLGADFKFHGISMKPGSPAMLTKLRGVSVLSLSGNPFACMVTFELLARPLLYAMNKDPELALKYKSAKLQTPFQKVSLTRRFVRGKLVNGNVYLPKGHSSGQLRSILDCNCFIDIPAETGTLFPGCDVSVVLL